MSRNRKLTPVDHFFNRLESSWFGKVLGGVMLALIAYGVFALLRAYVTGVQ